MPTSISHSFIGRILIAHSLFLLANAASQYRTIDDEFGDSATGDQIYYINGSGAWQQGATCSGCFYRPLPNLAYLQTWHDTSRHGNYPAVGLQFNFVGSALSVYCIIPNAIVDPRTSSASSLRFILDGQPAGNYDHTPDGSSQFIYNATVYSVSNLAHGNHTFSMIDDSTNVNSVVLFDYAAYIFDDPETTTAPSLDTSAPSKSSTSSPPQTTDASTTSSTSSQTQTTSQTLLANNTVPQSMVSSSTNEIVSQPTTNESTSTPTSPQNRMPIIIGCVVASVIVITLIALLLILWRRRLRITTQAAEAQAAEAAASPVINDPYHIIPFDAISPTISSPSTPRTEKKMPSFGYTGAGTGSSIDSDLDGDPQISIRRLREAVATLQDRQDQILTEIRAPPVYTTTLQ